MKNQKPGPQAALTWDNAPEVLTVEEAARLVRISRNTCYRAIKQGILPAFNFGKRQIRVYKKELRRVFGEQLELTAAFDHLPEA